MSHEKRENISEIFPSAKIFVYYQIPISILKLFFENFYLVISIKQFNLNAFDWVFEHNWNVARHIWSFGGRKILWKIVAPPSPFLLPPLFISLFCFNKMRLQLFLILGII